MKDKELSALTKFCPRCKKHHLTCICPLTLVERDKVKGREYAKEGYPNER